jgi:hypothetical protein
MANDTPKTTVPFDPNKLRDDIQDMLVDAYGELNITCYRKTADILAVAVTELQRLIDWEDTHAS